MHLLKKTTIPVYLTLFLFLALIHRISKEPRAQAEQKYINAPSIIKPTPQRISQSPQAPGLEIYVASIYTTPFA